MVNDNLLNYIKENRKKGFSDEVIKIALLEAGWKNEDVEEGFKEMGVRIFKKIPNKLSPIVIVIVVVVVLAVLFAIYKFSPWFNFLK